MKPSIAAINSDLRDKAKRGSDDEAIISAALSLHYALDGTEIDAPGPVSDALRALKSAVWKSGR